MNGLRNACGIIAASTVLLQAAVGTGVITLGPASNWIAIGGIIAGVIFKWDWLHGPAVTPAAQPPPQA